MQVWAASCVHFWAKIGGGVESFFSLYFKDVAMSYVFDRLTVAVFCGKGWGSAKKKTAGSFFFSRKMSTFAIQFGV